MSTVATNTRKKSFPDPHRISSLAIIFLIALVGMSTFITLSHFSKPTKANTSFSFTVAGDYAQTNHTTANLNYIANSGVSFDLAIGDLNYDHSISSDAWSKYVKSHLPANFPFEILAGNEDTRQINKLAADLPDHIGNVSGTYAKEYYFDYPPGAPLARFILISPGGVVPGYDYSKGSSHYNWVAQTIDSARAANIPWVIVAMHEPCISIHNSKGNPVCPSDGSTLQDLLVSKKVDLVLEGHNHSYQASKQLAINGTTCTTIQVNGYNPNCVVNATTSLTKGAGTVFVITGTGGREPLSTLNTSDPETGYFRKWIAANVNETWGVSQFTISATQLTEQFVAIPGQTFPDSFTIT